MRSIQTGFDDEAAYLRSALGQRERLIVVGYSGADYFDVDPALAAFEPGFLVGHAVLWVAHQQDGHWSGRQPAATDPQPIRLLERAGAAVTVLCARTSDVVDAVGGAWRLDVPRVRPGRSRAPSLSTTSASTAERAYAAFALLRQLRLHSMVADRLDDAALNITPIERFRATTDILWERGHSSTARRLWRAAPVEVPRWERTERIGACLWEQGRLVPAYVWLRWHRRRLQRGTPERLRLAETTGRVVLRMIRSPDTRWLGRRVVRSMVAELGTVTQAAGLDTFRRANDVIAQLRASENPSSTADDARTSGEWFLEAGDVTAVLAYRHTFFRRTYSEEISTVDLADRYRRLQADKDRVGAVGARVMLLPGAERVYSIKEFVVGLFASQFAPWHGLFAGFTVRRVRWVMSNVDVSRARQPVGASAGPPCGSPPTSR